MQKFIFFTLMMLMFNAPVRAQDCFDMSQLACETFHLTNLERQKLGLSALGYSPAAFAMAQEHSQDMSQRDYFNHSRPAFADRPAEGFSQRVYRFGLSRGVAENIALNSTPERVVAAWMSSPGHRKNILNPQYKSFAVGQEGRLYTQVFSVVDSPYETSDTRTIPQP